MGANSPLPKVSPAFPEDGVAVVLAADENFVNYLGVTLRSVIANTDPRNRYDLIVLSIGIGAESEALLVNLAEGQPNISIRLVDMRPAIEPMAEALHVGHNDHVSVATYFRLFITTIFADYKRAVYLDCDLASMADVAELFHTDLEGALWGAVLDFFAYRDFYNNYKGTTKWLANLQVENPLECFNAGVLLFDLDAMREFDFERKAIAALQRMKKPRLHDQDVLNHVGQGRVKLLDPAWNSQGWVEQSSQERLEGTVPDHVFQAFRQSCLAPKIIHYLTKRKPWLEPGPPLARHFWRYAAQTPFYHEILLNNLGRRSQEAELFKRYIRHPHGWITWLFYKAMVLFTRGTKRVHYQRRADRIKETTIAIRKMSRSGA